MTIKKRSRKLLESGEFKTQKSRTRTMGRVRAFQRYSQELCGCSELPCGGVATGCHWYDHSADFEDLDKRLAAAKRSAAARGEERHEAREERVTLTNVKLHKDNEE